MKHNSILQKRNLTGKVNIWNLRSLPKKKRDIEDRSMSSILETFGPTALQSTALFSFYVNHAVEACSAVNNAFVNSFGDVVSMPMNRSKIVPLFKI